MASAWWFLSDLVRGLYLGVGLWAVLRLEGCVPFSMMSDVLENGQTYPRNNKLYPWRMDSDVWFFVLIFLWDWTFCLSQVGSIFLLYCPSSKTGTNPNYERVCPGVGLILRPDFLDGQIVPDDIILFLSEERLVQSVCKIRKVKGSTKVCQCSVSVLRHRNRAREDELFLKQI